MLLSRNVTGAKVVVVVQVEQNCLVGNFANTVARSASVMPTALYKTQGGHPLPCCLIMRLKLACLISLKTTYFFTACAFTQRAN